ncbi:hypothetical protein LARI1_G009174 [Lachnellula arida]|uniref:RING-type E3 ubiquitin transferase n=1 Tax=Lachnellula arida TaxID=1316785 RepID=A0A8T9B6T9_9HELO|nr:hypothetical protein LARI1_G009174 [Lachnellula arida]
MDIQTRQQITLRLPHHQDKAEGCCICSEAVDLPRSDGRTEELLVLPCSHTFGSICIIRWLSHSPNRSCPLCRRRMIYRGCGHAVKPYEVARAPRCVREEDMPDLCLVCRGGGVLEEQVRVIRERQMAVQRTLQGLRTWFPGLVGGVFRVDTVESRIGASKRKEEKEVAAIYAELEKDREEW